ncbi:MAG: ribosome biogenesis GTPase Der [Myxococcales bacterium]|nr:ribosome biogenesis GTPase Der [Myxococcales bacterium]
MSEYNPEAVRPIVAIVGRPNVGKSQLFNRLARRSRSIVADQPGVTRDRIYADAELAGQVYDRAVILVDTGGFDPESVDPIMRRVLEQSELAVDEADAIIFLTDGQAGVMPEDFDVATLLRRSGKPIVLAVNKIDGPSHENLAHEFHRLGLPEVIPISAAHGRNVGELAELVVDRLPPIALRGDEGHPESFPMAPLDAIPGDPIHAERLEAQKPIRVAVIGRPNAGKSSLVNRLLGEDRHLVSEVAGTTVDSVDSVVEASGQSYLFIDTAGIRRKRSIIHRVEKFSVFAALKGLERSDVALLLLDTSEDLARQDARVSAFAYEKGKAVILVVSKWDKAFDGLTTRAHTQAIRDAMPHLAYAPVVFTSAHTGRGVDKLLPMVRRIHREYARRVPTGQLNRFVDELTQRHAPPSKKGRSGRIYYMTQVDIRPPRFLVSVNNPELIHFSYRRFVMNELRRSYGFEGVPLLLGYRSHKNEDRGRKVLEKGAAKASMDTRKQATAMKRARKKNKTLGLSGKEAMAKGRKGTRKTSIKRLLSD